MSSSFSISNLPYDLPNNLNEQLRILSNIVKIPFSLVKDGGQDLSKEYKKSKRRTITTCIICITNIRCC